MPIDRRTVLALPLAALGSAIFTRTAYAADAPATTSVPFTSGTEGYDTFRIPALVRTGRGTIIAFAEGRGRSASDTGNIDVVARRSTDGGRTWGALQVVAEAGTNTQGNPAPVVDPRTGRIVLLTCRNSGSVTETQITTGAATPEQSRRVFVQHSDNDGLGWSELREITASAKLDNWRWYATGPGHAIALTHGRHRGRLVVPADHSIAPPPGSTDTGAEAKYYGGHDLISDDGGRSWHIGYVDDDPDGFINVNETTAAQLPDGRIYFNARNHKGIAEGVRCDAYSDDGGRTLVDPYEPQPTLAGPVVQGSVLQLRGGPLLYSGPADPSARKAMSLRASTDDGSTWTPVLQLSPLPAAYSDLVQLSVATVGLLYETGRSGPYESISFARIAMSAL
jgi:sialidase-1